MTRPRPAFRARSALPPPGFGCARLATLAFATPHPGGGKAEGRKTIYRNRFTPTRQFMDTFTRKGFALAKCQQMIIIRKHRRTLLMIYYADCQISTQRVPARFHGFYYRQKQMYHKNAMMSTHAMPPNKALEPAPVGAGIPLSRFTVFGPAWLSFRR